MAGAVTIDPPSPTVRFGLWPLTGRRSELARGLDVVTHLHRRALVISGPAGVGKSRLAEELLRAVAAEGRTVARATATESSRTVPLAAIAHLLPEAVASTDHTRIVGFLRDAASSGGGSLVLHVDDAHLLDTTSAALLMPILASGFITLVMTVRSGEAIPDAIESLWRGDQAEVIELTELTRQSSDTLLHRSLGGPVDGQSAEQLWQASRGNPLYLRELVVGSKATGALRLVDDVWRLDGPIIATDALRSLILRRIAEVPRDCRRILDVLSIVGPIGLKDLSETAGEDLVNQLEVSGLVEIRVAARRFEVVLAHPIHGELLRNALTHTRIAAICRKHVARVEAHGSRRRGDSLTLATWSMDADGTAPVAVLLRAAELAHEARDFAAVERLGRAALLEQYEPSTARLVAEALYEQGGWDEAEQLLAEAEAVATESSDRVRIAVTRAANLFWGLARPEDALAVNARVQLSLSGDDKAELQAHRASMLLFAGRPQEAVTTARELAASASRRVQAAAAVALGPALAMVGKPSAALAAVEEGLSAQGHLKENLASISRAQQLLNKVLVLTEAGRLTDAWAVAQTSNSSATAERNAIAQIRFAYSLGRIALLQGRPETARQWFVHEIAHCRSISHRVPERLGQAGLAMASAYLGDAAAASAAVLEASWSDAGWFGVFGGEVARGGAWAFVALNQPALARDMLAKAAGDLASAGNVAQEAAVLHDLSRLGGTSAARLTELAQHSDSALIKAYAAHARGRESGDAAQLEAAADAFAPMGAMLYAAEAVAAMAEACRRAGDQRAAIAATRRHGELRDLLEGSRTPALVVTGAVVPLSLREREIAALAAEGIPSRSIAERLFLSTRTVDNHLQTVYRKLGVSGRVELAAALDLPGEESA